MTFLRATVVWAGVLVLAAAALVGGVLSADARPLHSSVVIGDYFAVDYPGAGRSVQSASGGYAADGPGLYSLAVSTEGNGGMTLSLRSRHPLRPGLYYYAATASRDPYETVSLRVGEHIFPDAVGYVRILQLVQGPSPTQLQFAATFVLRNTGGVSPVTYGSVGLDTPVAMAIPGEISKARLGDYNGDGITDVAVWRPSTGRWYILGSPSIQYGQRADIPVPGDYSGRGVSDLAVWRPSNGNWYVRGHEPIHYGHRGDMPVPGDYDGNGTTDMAVWRPSTGQWFLRGHAPIHYGTNGDRPTQSDYDGNGTTDISVWRPSTGAWYLQHGQKVTLGRQGDVPIPGPYWCGIGPCPWSPSQRAVFRPATAQWLFQQPAYEVPASSQMHANDTPTPGVFNDDYLDELASYQPSTGRWNLPIGSLHYGTVGDIPV